MELVLARNLEMWVDQSRSWVVATPRYFVLCTSVSGWPLMMQILVIGFLRRLLMRMYSHFLALKHIPHFVHHSASASRHRQIVWHVIWHFHVDRLCATRKSLVAHLNRRGPGLIWSHPRLRVDSWSLRSCLSICLCCFLCHSVKVGPAVCRGEMCLAKIEHYVIYIYLGVIIPIGGHGMLLVLLCLAWSGLTEPVLEGC